MNRYSRFDAVFALATMALATLAIAFGLTPGLVAEITESGDVARYCSQYNSTGSDDDACISVFGFLIFGAAFVFLGPVSSRRRPAKAAIKALAFCAAWLFQLLMLHWIEVGSITHTVFVAKNIVLASWLVLFSGSLVFILLAYFKTFKPKAIA